LSELVPYKESSDPGVPITYALTPEDLQEQTTIEFDVILNCASYKSNMEIMKFAIEHNIPYCDLGGNPEVVQKQRWFCESFEDEGRCPPVVADCGVSPGVSNVFAVHLAKQGYDTIRVRCGGVFDGFAMGNILNYELLFSPDGLISEYSGQCPMLVNGELVMEDSVDYVEPFLHDKLHLDIMDRQIGFESAHTSNNSPEVVMYLQEIGVKYYDYMTIRDVGHWDKIRVLKNLGYCCGDRKKDEELINILSKQEFERIHEDILFLMVRASNSGKNVNEKKELTIMRVGNPDGFSAMEELTAWGITLVAYHMVSGLGKPDGFATPERFIDGGWMIDELEKRLK
jgi:saccharopine dehydrogenase-like NADP-dependent oxidoreductase